MDKAHYHCDLCGKATDRPQRARDHYQKKHVKGKAAEAARVKDVQGGALARSCKKRKATTQEVEAADPSLQEAGAGVDAFSIQSRIAVGRGADVLLTKDILRSTGLGCGVDTFGHVVRHRSVGELPLPGQQLKILPDPASEAAKQQRFWYAMYLGEAPAQTFDGLAEKEDASRIKWFNEVGRGGGSQRRFVLSAEDVIRQESIRDHGTFLELDQTLQFGGGQPQFILLSDEEIAATNEEDDKRLAVGDMAAACVGGRALLAGAGAGAGTGAAAGSSGGGGSASPSVHHVHGAVRGAPEPMVVLSDVGSVVAALDVVTVDKAGKECFPSRCRVSSPGHACHFTMKGWAASGKQGFTMQGPVSLRYRRYLCTTHSSIVSTKVSDRQYFDEATKPTPELIQLGKKGLVCTVGFVTSVFMSWVNNRYVFASVRRDILIWWSGALVDRFRESREPVYIQSTEQLAALTPNKQQVTDMVLLVYHGVVKPSIQSHDAVMAQVEGSVIRLDCSFAAVSKVRTDKRRFSSCILTLTGTRGSLLRAPTPLASEKHVDILGQVRVVLEQRRSALGAISCPVGLVTDDILRDEFGLKALLTSVFPEVMADPTRACLIVQDVVHRRWAFDRHLDKGHRDTSAALEDVKYIFGRLTFDEPARASAPDPPRDSPPRGASKAMYPALAASAAALASDPHADIPEGHKTTLRKLLSDHGVNFAQHPLWLAVTSEAPHRAVVVRVADALGLHLKVPRGGYRDAVDFRREIVGFVAWYKTTRKALHGDGGALSHCAALGALLTGAPVPLEASPGGASGSAPSQTGGATDNVAIEYALQKVLHERVVQGLLNNQKLTSHVPKGTSPCESVHSFMDTMIMSTTLCVDTSETVLSMARLTYNGTKAWKPHLKRAFDSDTLLASLSATARSLIHVTSGDEGLAGVLCHVIVPPRRTADDLLAEGYQVVRTKDDDFTEEELAAVTGALTRWVLET